MTDDEKIKLDLITLLHREGLGMLYTLEQVDQAFNYIKDGLTDRTKLPSMVEAGVSDKPTWVAEWRHE